jgi:serine/threonine protein kinase
MICLSNGCVTDNPRTVGDYKLIRTLGRGAFDQVYLAKKKSTAACNSSKDLFALKLVYRPRVSNVEKQVLLQAANHPLLIQLIKYFDIKVSCSFRQSISMH